MRKHHNFDWWFLVAISLAILYAIGFSVLTIRRHLAFNTHAFDLGLQQHVVWNTFHGRWFEYTYMVGFNPSLVNHLGDHVQPILWLISWLYFFYDGAETLLVVQSFIVASGVIPIFLLARHWKLHSLVGVVFAGTYLFHPALQGAILFDFHPLTMAASLLLWAFYFLEIEEFYGLAIASLLVLTCKENLALAMMLLGAYALVRRRAIVGSILFFVGMVWFLLCFFVILPMFNSGIGSNAFSRYQYLGANWLAVAVNLLSHPNVLWERFTESLTLHYLRDVFVPYGGLSLFSPQVLIVLMSELGLNVLSSFDAQRSINYQYSAILVGTGAVAMVNGAAWLSWRMKKVLRFPVKYLEIICALFALTCSLGFQFRAYHTIRFMGLEYRDSYRITEHDRIGKRIIAQIPSDATVSAQSDISPHVSQRRYVYVFPTVNDAEYVILDATSTIFPVHLFPIEGLAPEEAYLEYIRRLLHSGVYNVIQSEDGWVVLAETSASSMSSDAIDTFLLDLASFTGK